MTERLRQDAISRSGGALRDDMVVLADKAGSRTVGPWRPENPAEGLLQAN